MDEVTLADILLILTTSIIIAVILGLVNRGKKNETDAEENPAAESDKEKQQK